MKLSRILHDKRTWEAAGAEGATPPAEPAAVEPAADPTSAAEPAGPDLSFIPEDFHKDGAPDLEAFKAHYSDLVAKDAQHAESLAGVPEDGNYNFALPEDLSFGDLDLPEGFTVELATDDPAMQPLYAEFGAMLKEIGAPAEVGQKAAALIAKYEATKYSQGFAAAKAEMASLGTPAQQQARVAAIDRALGTRLPAEQAAALKAATTSAKGIQALEKLLAPRSTPSPTPTPDTADVENMTPYERLQHANKMAKP